MPKSRARRQQEAEEADIKAGLGGTYDPATGTTSFLGRQKPKPRVVPTLEYPQGSTGLVYPEDIPLITEGDMGNAWRQWYAEQKRKRKQSP